MKKFICIILSMIIVFSAFSVTSFATYTPKAEEAIKNLDFEKGVSFKLTYGASETLIMHRKDNKLALELIHDGVDFRMIADDNTAYLYFTKFPFFYFKAEGIADELFPSEFFDDSFFIDDSFFVVNFNDSSKNIGYLDFAASIKTKSYFSSSFSIFISCKISTAFPFIKFILSLSPKPSIFSLASENRSSSCSIVSIFKETYFSKQIAE